MGEREDKYLLRVWRGQAYPEFGFDAQDFDDYDAGSQWSAAISFAGHMLDRTEPSTHVVELYCEDECIRAWDDAADKQLRSVDEPLDRDAVLDAIDFAFREYHRQTRGGPVTPDIEC